MSTSDNFLGLSHPSNTPQFLEGGILNFAEAERHLHDVQYDSSGCALDLPPVAGCMIGRAAYNNPLLFATADSTFYGVSDPCLSRREIIDRHVVLHITIHPLTWSRCSYHNPVSLWSRRYLNYCDWVQSEGGPVVVSKGKRKYPKTMYLFKPLFNLFNGCPRSHKFRTMMNDVFYDLQTKSGEPSPR